MYAAGHGLSDSEQYILLNESKRSDALYNIEEMMRNLSKYCFLIAVYDMCTQDATVFKTRARLEDEKESAKLAKELELAEINRKNGEAKIPELTKKIESDNSLR